MKHALSSYLNFPNTSVFPSLQSTNSCKHSVRDVAMQDKMVNDEDEIESLLT